MPNNINMDDFMTDSRGRLVPKSKVSEVDKLRDEVVRDIASAARNMSEQLKVFRDGAMDAVNAFVEISAEEHNVQWGGKKGNLKLTSFDGTTQVSVDVVSILVLLEFGLRPPAFWLIKKFSSLQKKKQHLKTKTYPCFCG